MGEIIKSITKIQSPVEEKTKPIKKIKPLVGETTRSITIIQLRVEEKTKPIKKIKLTMGETAEPIAGMKSKTSKMKP